MNETNKFSFDAFENANGRKRINRIKIAIHIYPYYEDLVGDLALTFDPGGKSHFGFVHDLFFLTRLVVYRVKLKIELSLMKLTTNTK